LQLLVLQQVQAASRSSEFEASEILPVEFVVKDVAFVRRFLSVAVLARQVLVSPPLLPISHLLGRPPW
jgi:hypothetical protein